MSRYAIWNKKDSIITPVGEVLTPAQWITRHPVAGISSMTIVCAGGEINGAFFGTLNQMIEMFNRRGCDFSSCKTDEEKLQAIEDFEDAERLASINEAKKKEESSALNESLTATSLASIAAQLEYQNMMTLEDVEA
jgi:hypothetical protein